MGLSYTPLTHTPLSIRDLARTYRARETRGNRIKLAAGVLVAVLIISGGLGYIFRDSWLSARGERVLGQQDRRPTAGSSSIARPESVAPLDDRKPTRYADEFIEFDLPDGWAARRFSSELVPNLLRVVEVYPASELPVFDSRGKLYKSLITVSITKERTDTGPVPSSARISMQSIDGVMAKIIEQRLDENFSDTLNKPLEGLTFIVNFPLGNNTVVIVYRTTAPADAINQRREMFLKFLKTIALPGKPDETEQQTAASEADPESIPEPTNIPEPSVTPRAANPTAQTSPATPDRSEGELKEFRMKTP
ncbi:MAG: hypothetical protein N2691_02175 [Patescibacteria group bacterium]|nr:hypothetical protein [Patescibacteria group bacterium]